MKGFLSRKKLLLLALLILLSIVIGFGSWTFYKKTENKSEKKCENCNIMLIDIDILRGDELSCLGYSRNTTPNICEFAKNGAVFKDNYSTSYWTLPSIFSTMTSLYPTFHGMQNAGKDILSPNITTLAEVLHKKGYMTVMVNGNKDTMQMLFGDNEGLRGFEMVTADPVEKVIDDLSKDNRPWFIYYYNSELHFPYLLPENTKPMEDLPAPKNLPINQTDFDTLLNKYLKTHYTEIFKPKIIDKYGSIILGSNKEDDMGMVKMFNTLKADPSKVSEYFINDWNANYQTYMESFDQNNPSDVKYVRMLYDTKLKLLDNKMGSVLQKLNSKQLSENTITVITSDHGENFGEHGFFTHIADFHSEVFYIPLIIKSPNILPTTIEQTTSNIDIFPTLLDLTGINSPGGLQGISLVPYINNQHTEKQSFAMSEYWGNVILENHDWLYFLPKDEQGVVKPTFYDRIKDPAEKENVIDKYPEMVNSLYKQASLLRSYNVFYENKPIVKPDVIKNIDKVKLDRLRKEGYF